MAKEWTKDRVRALLMRDDAVGWVAVERALVRLYERQTYAEQSSGDTKELNGVGFAGCDAQTGTWLVQTVIAEAKAQGRAEGHRLRGKAFAMARKIVLRYAGTQLLEIAKAAEKKQVASA